MNSIGYRHSQGNVGRYGTSQTPYLQNKHNSRAGILDEKIDAEFMERQRSQMRSGDGWRKPMHRPSKSQGGVKMNPG